MATDTVNGENVQLDFPRIAPGCVNHDCPHCRSHRIDKDALAILLEASRRAALKEALKAVWATKKRWGQKLSPMDFAKSIERLITDEQEIA